MMIWTAFIVGLAGSVHCVAMCSPLAFAATRLSPKVMANRTLYNMGRILTYGALGAAVGALGALANLTRYEFVLGGALGLLLVLLGLTGTSLVRIPILLPALYRLTTWLKRVFVTQVKNRSNLAMFSMGVINGLLPCGLTYFALTYCIILPNAQDGFIFMTFFGAGTLPAMIGVPLLAGRIARGLSFRRITSVTMIVLGVLLLARTAFFQGTDRTSLAAGQTEVVCP
jgi:sulfite exporter TauE/SafE